MGKCCSKVGAINIEDKMNNTAEEVVLKGETKKSPIDENPVSKNEDDVVAGVELGALSLEDAAKDPVGATEEQGANKLDRERIERYRRSYPNFRLGHSAQAKIVPVGVSVQDLLEQATSAEPNVSKPIETDESEASSTKAESSNIRAAISQYRSVYMRRRRARNDTVEPYDAAEPQCTKKVKTCEKFDFATAGYASKKMMSACLHYILSSVVLREDEVKCFAAVKDRLDEECALKFKMFQETHPDATLESFEQGVPKIIISNGDVDSLFNRDEEKIKADREAAIKLAEKMRKMREEREAAASAETQEKTE